MTIPILVMVISAVIWFALSTVKEPRLSLTPWMIDVCRILFAVSALVVMATVAGVKIF